MLKKERQLWDFILRHRLKLFLLAATVLSLYARFALRGIPSADMEDCLIPWYDEIKALGGLRALSTQVGNYNVPYQTLIALLTYLPVKPIYAYKGLSILFDYAMGAALAVGVHDLTKSRTKAAVAYVVTVSLPSVVLNSAAWGQCDAIFTFFLVASFVCLMREKHTAAFLLYGCAFAFKLQAVFFLPFLLFYYVGSQKTSAWRFLLVPVPMIVFSLAALFQGRSLSSLLSVYGDQMSWFPQISLNYPSFWVVLVENGGEAARTYYQELAPYCVAAAVIVLGVMMVWLLRRERLDTPALLLVATWMMYTCVLFLPAMHERYAYPVLIFALFACFAKPWMMPCAAALLALDMQTYGAGLFYKAPLPWIALALINLACYAGVTLLTVKEAQGKTTGLEQE